MDIFQDQVRRIKQSIKYKQVTIIKSTAYFTRTILTHLEKRAETDYLFVESFANPNKNIDDCCIYILNEVQNGFQDDEIFGMAVHYYHEKNIEVGKTINHAQIAVNHIVELTEEEKAEIKQEAIQKVQSEAYNKMMQPRKKAKRIELNNQPSLIDF